MARRWAELRNWARENPSEATIAVILAIVVIVGIVWG